MNPEAIARLVADRLTFLYPAEADIRRLLDAADITPARINVTGHAANTWHFALKEAIAQDRLLELIEAAMIEYPTDPFLIAAYDKLSLAT